MPKMSSLLIIFMCFIYSSNAYNASNRGLKSIAIKNKIGETVGLYKESHALVIAVSNYNNGWPKLPGVKIDAEKVTQALRKNGFQVTLINDPNSQQLGTAFNQFIKRYGNKVENRLLFYFAGHGFNIKPEWGEVAMGYIVPTDAPNPDQDIEGFQALALPIKRIEEYALRINAKHGLFLFDSCFSGSLFAITRTRTIPENISYKTTQPVRQFITAGSANEKVPDVSIFRQQFIAALNGEGDLNQDGYLSATELGQFLQEKVINYSKGAQHPQYGKMHNPNLDKGDFIFILPQKKQPKPLLKLAGMGTGIANSYENNFWDAVKQSNSAEMYQAYLDEYPQGHYVRIARIQLEQLKPRLSKPAPVVPKLAQLTIRSNVYGDEVWINGKKKGATRLDLQLKAGTYQIEVKKAGFTSDQRKITLKAGEQKKWIAQLRQQVYLKPPAELMEKLKPTMPFSIYSSKPKRMGKYQVYNDTVIDTKTGLMWKRCVEGLSGINCSKGKQEFYTWNVAVNKFKKVAYAGYDDIGYSGWRLPTIKELRTLVYCSNGTTPKVARQKTCSGGWGSTFKNNSYKNPTINQQVFPNTAINKNNYRSYQYWSSSTYVGNPYAAWRLNFKNGMNNNDERSSEYAVRLVRVGR